MGEREWMRAGCGKSSRIQIYGMILLCNSLVGKRQNKTTEQILSDNLSRKEVHKEYYLKEIRSQFLQILGYLKKLLKKGFVVDPSTLVTTKAPISPTEHFEEDEINPNFPEQTVQELDVTIICDVDRAHDLVNGSDYCLHMFTPMYWKSTHQKSVHTSTVRSEFTALKKVVEVAITMLCNTISEHWASRYIKTNKNLSLRLRVCVFLNSSIAANSLNKQPIALAYHFA